MSEPPALLSQPLVREHRYLLEASMSPGRQLQPTPSPFPGDIEFFRKHLVEHLVLVPSAPSR